MPALHHTRQVRWPLCALFPPCRKLNRLLYAKCPHGPYWGGERSINGSCAGSDSASTPGWPSVACQGCAASSGLHDPDGCFQVSWGLHGGSGFRTTLWWPSTQLWGRNPFRSLHPISGWSTHLRPGFTGFSKSLPCKAPVLLPGASVSLSVKGNENPHIPD
jgi:hypothetical protein